MTKEDVKGIQEEKQRIIKWMSEQQIADDQIEMVFQEILSTQDDQGKNIKQIFLAGLGRSGYDGSGFAMRLAHLGFNVHVIGEATCTAVAKDDLFIVVSGGGRSLDKQIETASEIGAKIIAITSLPRSKNARMADIKLIVPGREEGEEGASMSFFERQIRGKPVLPLGTAFELLAMVVLDAIITQIAVIKKKSDEDLRTKHANLNPE